MSFKVDGKTYVFVQSAIDPSVWMIVRGDKVKAGKLGSAGSGGYVSKDAGRPLHAHFDPEVAESQCIGFLVTYVDDFLILASDPVIEQVRGVIEAKWRITEKPTVSYGSGCSVEYLSVNITALEHGYFLDQAVYCNDLLAKWSMDECRAIGSLEDPGGDIDEDEEPSADDVHTAQRLAGGLNWLATRTRPDVAFIVSQLSSAATKQPKRAIALGKRTLRYLAGTRDRGIMLDPRGSSSKGDGGVLHSERSGNPPDPARIRGCLL